MLKPFRWLFILLVLMPVTVYLGGDGISCNYSYVILIPIVAGMRFRRNNDGVSYILFLVLSGAIGVFVNILILECAPEMIIRQMTSLFLAIAPCVFLFHDLSSYYNTFKKVVVFVSVIYSLYALTSLSRELARGVTNTFQLKSLLGESVPEWPQRYILVLFAGFFYSLQIKGIKFYLAVLISILILITIGATFLRAAYVAVFISLIVFMFVRGTSDGNIFGKGLSRSFQSHRFLIVIVMVLVGFVVGPLGLNDSIDSTFEYVSNSVFDIINGDVSGDASSQDRLYMFQTILEGVKVNPTTGLGGAGIYVLDPRFGSAHNQYLDQLLRFGIVGLIFILYFTFRIYRHFWGVDPAVIGIVTSYVLFGLAHETMKYSYGGVIFFFILSLTYSGRGVLGCNQSFGYSKI